MYCKKNLLNLALIFLFTLSCSVIKGQAIKYRTFDIDSKRALNVLTEEEKKEPVVIIKEKKVYEMIENKQKDLEGYVFFHKIIKVNKEDKLQSFNKIYLPVSDPNSLLALKACTYSPSGKVIELYKGDMKQIKEDDENYLILALDGLEVGSEIEYFYLVQANFGTFYTNRISNLYFTRDYEYEFISPDKLIYESKSYNGLKDMQDTTLDEKNHKTLALKNLQPQEPERYAANDAHEPRVEIKLSFNLYSGANTKVLTFTDAAKKYYRNLHDLSKDDTKTIDKIYDKLKLKKMKTEDEKIRALENHFKTNYNIVDGLDISMSDAYKNNFFTKFQLAQIFSYILEKETIEYELVFTTQKDQAEFDPTFETWNFLKELFFYIPSSKKYFSPSIMVYRYGMILPDCMNQKGLFIKTISIGETKSALNSIKFIEPANFDNNIDNIDATISFTKEMDLTNIALTRTQNGYNASNLRPFYFYVNEDKKAEVVDDHMKLGIKDAVVRNLIVSNSDINSDDIYKDFVAKADVEVASLMESAGEKYLFKVGLCIGPQAELYQEKARRLPAYVSYPHTFERKITVNIPDGYEAKGLEALKMNVILNDAGKNTAGFESNYIVEGNKIIITVKEYYLSQNYPLAKFEDFRKVINAAADFNKITIAFSKK